MPGSFSPTIAALDIGSNSFRLLIGCYTGQIRALHKEPITVRLAEGLVDCGTISDGAISRAIEALHSFRLIIRQYHIDTIRICGTEALRHAENRSILQAHCQEILHAPLEIITGELEAMLTQAGVFSGLATSPNDTLIVDVGGGSSEYIFSDASLFSPISQPIGAITLTENFLNSCPITTQQIELAQNHVLQVVSPVLNKIKSHASTLIGCGGTATALAALHLRLEQYDEKRVHGTSLDYTALEHIFFKLVAMTPQQRCLLPCLDQGRGEILLGGTLIFLVLLRFFSAEKMTISDSGLLEGIFLSQVPYDNQPSTLQAT